MKLIIAGGRDFLDYNKMRAVLEERFFGLVPCGRGCCSDWGWSGLDEVVCGMAQGADLLGKQIADEESIPVKEFPADWELYGKSAGHIRNGEMAKYADELLAFWDADPKNSGTFDMITQMTALGKPVHIVTYKPVKAYPKK